MRSKKNELQNAQMAIFFVLATEVMMFLALVSAYIVIRANVPDWPPIGQPRLPAEATAINTVALLISGLLYHLLVRKLGTQGHEDKSRFAEDLPLIKKYLWWSFGLGVFFVAFQGYEWLQLISYGLTMASGVYAGFFYTIIGCHAIHTVVGLILLLVVLIRPSYVKLQTIKWYWYFVVGLWPLLYVSVYLV
jgi:cytochrome c oxidase subunit III